MEIMMALTKHDIAGKVQAGLGFPKNQSVEITETLLELIKSRWNPAMMYWSVVSANSV
jgi:hypothetical protein